MSKQIIYLKEANGYNDILKKENSKTPIFFKRLIFLYKHTFNIITKKKIEDKEIWVLPIKEKYSLNKIEKILLKELKTKEKIFLLSDKLKENKVNLIIDKQNIEYITEEKIKKVLIFETLKYIVNLQDKEISNLDVTILVNNTNNINMYLLEKLAKQVKTLKIVSLNIYKFKKLEEKLYNEYGIPIQFSNSYRKSLEKSKLIINLDFNEFQINEYEIFDKAIILNCINDNIKIKTRLFSGIIVNSCDIKYKEELINKFKEIKLYESYSNLLLYASILENYKVSDMFEKLKIDKVLIINLIGNRGIINQKEFNNIFKKLDKNKKTE